MFDKDRTDFGFEENCLFIRQQFNLLRQDDCERSQNEKAGEAKHGETEAGGARRALCFLRETPNCRTIHLPLQRRSIGQCH